MGEVIQLTTSVGQNGVNKADDQERVIHLLNDVSVVEGGPVNPISMNSGGINPLISGRVAPDLIAGIHRFQNKQLGISDGRVDPGKHTLGLLNQKSGRRTDTNGKTIQAAVGRPPAVNNSGDQEEVIALLQVVPPADGGPTGPIFPGPFPGQASPSLSAAIGRFQTIQFGHSDGRVDPGGPTLALLNKKTNNGTKPPLPPPKVQQIISAAVGRAPAPNREIDFGVVLGLLNGVPPSEGGPESPINPITGGLGLNLFGLIEAIERFQRRQLQGRFDGRVDPGGSTMFLLNQKSKFRV